MSVTGHEWRGLTATWGWSTEAKVGAGKQNPGASQVENQGMKGQAKLQDSLRAGRNILPQTLPISFPGLKQVL